MGEIEMLINWTLAVSIIIVCVFFVRILFDKSLRKTYQCVLWGIVLVRLLVPNMPSSSLSLFNVMDRGLIGRQESSQVTQVQEDSLVESELRVIEEKADRLDGQMIDSDTERVVKAVSEEQVVRKMGIREILYGI